MHLKNKSEINFDAANKLIEYGLYPPSVHCSYYGVFQLLKYKINNSFEISYDDLETRINSDRRNTHSYIINFIKNEISEKLNIRESQNFYRKIKDLKFLREQSDYDNVIILIDKSNNAIRIAKELKLFIEKTF